MRGKEKGKWGACKLYPPLVSTEGEGTRGLKLHKLSNSPQRIVEKKKKKGTEKGQTPIQLDVSKK